MNNTKKEDESLLENLENKEGPTIYGVVIYNRGDDWEETTKTRKNVEALLALISASEKLEKELEEN